MVTLIIGSQILKVFVWCLEFAQGKLYPEDFFDEYSFKQLHREMCGQWQKCYGEVSMSIYYYDVAALMCEYLLQEDHVHVWSSWNKYLHFYALNELMKDIFCLKLDTKQLQIIIMFN